MFIRLAVVALVAAAPSSALKDVLVLGGTGVRGRPFVDSLVGVVNLTLVQRGRSYWDTHKVILNKTRDDIVADSCDRTKGSFKRCGIINIRSSKQKWDMCVDFYPKTEKQMEHTLEMLNDKCKHYIYVSSYMVYSATGKKTKGDFVEDDAQFPDRKKYSEEERKKIATENSVGHNYLLAETYLKENAEFPWTIVRPADLIGVKETDLRMWLLSVWAKSHREINIPLAWIKDEEHSTFSLLSTVELAHGLQTVMKKAFGTICCTEDVQGEVFNLAHEEQPTQQIFYGGVVAGHEKVALYQAPVPQSASVYPHDSRFINLSIKKAEKKLKWSPRTVFHWLLDITKFYDRVMYSEKYSNEKKAFVEMVAKVETEKFGKKMANWARNHYKIGVSSNKVDRKAIDFDDEDDEENGGGEPRAKKFSLVKQSDKKYAEEAKTKAKAADNKKSKKGSKKVKAGKKGDKVKEQSDKTRGDKKTGGKKGKKGGKKKFGKKQTKKWKKTAKGAKDKKTSSEEL